MESDETEVQREVIAAVKKLIADYGEEYIMPVEEIHSRTLGLTLRRVEMVLLDLSTDGGGMRLE
jgi:hypothetical protein